MASGICKENPGRGMTKLTVTINLQANLNELQQEKLRTLLEENAKHCALGYIHTEQQRGWLQAEAESRLET